MSRFVAGLVGTLCLVMAGCATFERKGTRAPATPLAPATPDAGATPSPMPTRPSVQTGPASWYGQGHHGRRTASGEMYDMNQLTAAHRSLPFGTRVRVTNLANDRAVVVRINDRGPFAWRRIIDVSYAAARALGALGSGLFNARLEVLEASVESPSASGGR